MNVDSKFRQSGVQDMVSVRTSVRSINETVEMLLSGQLICCLTLQNVWMHSSQNTTD